MVYQGGSDSPSPNFTDTAFTLQAVGQENATPARLPILRSREIKGSPVHQNLKNKWHIQDKPWHWQGNCFSGEVRSNPECTLSKEQSRIQSLVQRKSLPSSILQKTLDKVLSQETQRAGRLTTMHWRPKEQAACMG